MKTMQPMTTPRGDGQEREPVFIHEPCLTTLCWSPEMVQEYGPLAEQGCDCETDGAWLQVYVEVG